MAAAAGAKRAREGVSTSASGGRVQLNVGGTTFSTTIDTLTLNSRYFKETFSSEHFAPKAEDDEIFLDRDPCAFATLLKIMRSRSSVLLPIQSDPELCKAVLIEAEYFGVEWLLSEVKAQATRNLDYLDVPSKFISEPSVETQLVEEFNSKYLSIEHAIKHGTGSGSRTPVVTLSSWF